MRILEKGEEKGAKGEFTQNNAPALRSPPYAKKNHQRLNHINRSNQGARMCSGGDTPPCASSFWTNELHRLSKHGKENMTMEKISNENEKAFVKKNQLWNL